MHFCHDKIWFKVLKSITPKYAKNAQKLKITSVIFDAY